MLLYLTNYLAQFESGFNVFSYLTMRAILGALTALILSFVIGPRMIAKLSVNQVGQPVRPGPGPEREREGGRDGRVAVDQLEVPERVGEVQAQVLRVVAAALAFDGVGAPADQVVLLGQRIRIAVIGRGPALGLGEADLRGVAGEGVGALGTAGHVEEADRARREGVVRGGGE